MRRPPRLPQRVRSEDGFTLIELLVAMIVATIVIGAAFSFLIFTNEDASHITTRAAVDQTARSALQRIISELHSACVAPSVVPIIAGSNASTIRFVSETGEQASFSTVEKHEIIFTAPSGSAEGTLIENAYESTGGTAPNYTWATTPATTTKLLKGVRQTVYGSEKATPIFRYYRYYRSGDAVPTGHTTIPYGEINPATIETLSGTATVSSTEAPYVVKVTIAFTLAPEGTESVSFNHDRPVPLEDSAVFRMTPSSEATSDPNVPCTSEV